MKLGILADNLKADFSLPPQDRWRDIEVTSLHHNSETVVPGGLFVAIPGMVADGYDYIPQALLKGAVAIVSERSGSSVDLPLIQVADSRRALAHLAVCFYGNPSKSLKIAAVTGTNGKTSTTYIVESILKAAGYSTGVIGTISYRYGNVAENAKVTTPESLDLQRILAAMRDSGVTHVVMEASSHAISLGRLEGCELDVAAFTNITQDHLDFHGDMEAYFQAKKRLFSEFLLKSAKQDHACAVINTDYPKGRELADSLETMVLAIGHEKEAELCASDAGMSLSGNRIMLHAEGQTHVLYTPLVGRHNVENVLCAVGIARCLGIDWGMIEEGVAQTKTIPGRLEAVANGADRYVYVDYAHTPDALLHALKTLNQLSGGRIICVFGCGGDRDAKKRPIMGNIAVQNSHLAVVTSDNPRSEDPQKIIADILSGIQDGKIRRYRPEEIKKGFNAKGYVTIPDRKTAIKAAVEATTPGDTLLIAGKGHETYQILNNGTIDFDDRQVAAEALTALEVEK